ncbi:hypothetical protein FB45DRAFT_869059 [Roridomyces roridus]|uniref:F-box domain-containing protein n=1 Tax=Roridomyces roridus TaxID=1738132 RepID=A0AAD7FLL3_9AGAR|nr:hypothetical protein FB45DRAFT_869059 [Roridomyces roridus]
MGPRLPLEIVDLVIGELDEDRNTLLSCALVCRDWVPFARGNLPICIRGSAEFIQTAQAPTATLMSAIRVEIRNPEATRLFELPSHPTLDELAVFNSEFITYSGFIRSMTGLPHLRDLELWGATWGKSRPGQPSRLPPIILHSLHLCIFDELPEDELIPFRVRKLELDNTIPSALISRHLRHLGGHLTELCIGDSELEGIDFSQNSGVQDLEICYALGIKAATGEIYGAFDLGSLFGRLSSDCCLHNLTLHVTMDTSMAEHRDPWTAGSLLALLRERGFQDVAVLQIIVTAYISGLDHLTLDAILLASAQIPTSFRTRVVAGRVITPEATRVT